MGNILSLESGTPDGKDIRPEIPELQTAPENAYLVCQMFQDVKEKESRVRQIRLFYGIVHD